MGAGKGHGMGGGMGDRRAIVAAWVRMCFLLPTFDRAHTPSLSALLLMAGLTIWGGGVAVGSVC